MCDDLDFFFKPIVIVTGFGPFKKHPVNASWEAVKLMNKAALEEKLQIELVQLEIPVTYKNVDEFVPALWETHEPKLMIHVGVSSIAESFNLETQAHKKGYQKRDYFDRCPANHMCPAEGPIRLHTKLDISKLCNDFNEGSEIHKAVSSRDAGRYLCEYMYYTSLSADNRRTLFVHVPDINLYSSEHTARGLERLLELCLAQIEDAENKKETDDLTEKLHGVTIAYDITEVGIERVLL